MNNKYPMSQSTGRGGYKPMGRGAPSAPVSVPPSSHQSSGYKPPSTYPPAYSGAPSSHPSEPKYSHGYNTQRAPYTPGGYRGGYAPDAGAYRGSHHYSAPRSADRPPMSAPQPYDGGRRPPASGAPYHGYRQPPMHSGYDNRGRFPPHGHAPRYDMDNKYGQRDYDSSGFNQRGPMNTKPRRKTRWEKPISKQEISQFFSQYFTLLVSRPDESRESGASSAPAIGPPQVQDRSDYSKPGSSVTYAQADPATNPYNYSSAPPQSGPHPEYKDDYSGPRPSL